MAARARAGEVEATCPQTGSDDEPLVGEHRPVVEGDRAGCEIAGDRAAAQDELDVRDRGAATEGEAGVQPRDVVVAEIGQDVLGQRRPVVREVDLLPHHGDRTVVPGRPQLLGGAQAAQRGADHDDVPGHGQAWPIRIAWTGQTSAASSTSSR